MEAEDIYRFTIAFLIIAPTVWIIFDIFTSYNEE
jgi:hypothetical protein